MRTRTLLGLAAAAALLGGCATGPYYYDNTYAQNDGYYYERPVTRYYSDPYYTPPHYYPRYYGPAVGLGFGFSYGRSWHHRH